MRQSASLVCTIVGCFLLTAACDSSKPSGESKKPEERTTKQAAEDTMKEEEVPGANTALMAIAGSPGRMENDEGVSHYKQGHWDVAEVHFRKSLGVDPGLAEAHFNLGLSLDKLGKHEDATRSFKKAVELAPNNPQIAQSPILKAHVGL